MRFTFLLIATLTAAAVSAAPAQKPDGEWTVVSGKVTSVSPDSFKLEYNDNKITVEMDDYDWDADGYKLVKGDQVTVTGKVDKGLFEKATIEASSVYVKNLDAFFYASPADEEAAPVISAHVFMIPKFADGASVKAQGKVVSTSDDDFVLDTGFRKLEVDTDQLSFNPVDNKGLVQVEKGDRVRVAGIVDDDFLEGKEINARYILDFTQ